MDAGGLTLWTTAESVFSSVFVDVIDRTPILSATRLLAMEFCDSPLIVYVAICWIWTYLFSGINAAAVFIKAVFFVGKFISEIWFSVYFFNFVCPFFAVVANLGLMKFVVLPAFTFSTRSRYLECSGDMPIGGLPLALDSSVTLYSSSIFYRKVLYGSHSPCLIWVTC